MKKIDKKIENFWMHIGYTGDFRMQSRFFMSSKISIPKSFKKLTKRICNRSDSSPKHFGYSISVIQIQFSYTNYKKYQFWGCVTQKHCAKAPEQGQKTRLKIDKIKIQTFSIFFKFIFFGTIFVHHFHVFWIYYISRK